MFMNSFKLMIAVIAILSLSLIPVACGHVKNVHDDKLPQSYSNDSESKDKELLEGIVNLGGIYYSTIEDEDHKEVMTWMFLEKNKIQIIATSSELKNNNETDYNEFHLEVTDVFPVDGIDGEYSVTAKLSDVIEYSDDDKAKTELTEDDKKEHTIILVISPDRNSIRATFPIAHDTPLNLTYKI